MYKPHPQLSGMILEKKFWKSTLVKLVVFAATSISQSTLKIPFKSVFLNRFPYSLWLTTVFFIAQAHSCNENDEIWTKIKRRNTMQHDSLVTTQHGNVRFRISCAWISCLSRRMEPLIGENLLLNESLTTLWTSTPWK